MVQWFNKQHRLIKIILLIIPFVNWIVELLVRWSHFFDKKIPSSLLLAILVTIPTGIAFGLIDAIWCLFFDRMIFVE